MSVIKKRTGIPRGHHPRIPYHNQGIEVGPALEEFQGVLRGVPTYVGGSEPLLRENA